MSMCRSSPARRGESTSPFPSGSWHRSIPLQPSMAALARACWRTPPWSMWPRTNHDNVNKASRRFDWQVATSLLFPRNSDFKFCRCIAPISSLPFPRRGHAPHPSLANLHDYKNDCYFFSEIPNAFAPFALILSSTQLKVARAWLCSLRKVYPVDILPFCRIPASASRFCLFSPPA